MNALARHLPRLQAEETFRLSNAVALGTGTGRKSDRDELIAALRDDVRRASSRRSSSDWLSDMADLGVTVVREPKS